jgi:hypothetical protein
MKAVPTPPGWLMVPATVEVPSPQLMEAVKSEMGATGLESVKVPTSTAPVFVPSVASMVSDGPAVSGSATFTVARSVTDPPSPETSVLAVKVPAAA